MKAFIIKILIIKIIDTLIKIVQKKIYQNITIHIFKQLKII